MRGYPFQKIFYQLTHVEDFSGLFLFLAGLLLLIILIGIYFLIFKGLKHFVNKKIAGILSAVILITGTVTMYHYNRDYITEAYNIIKEAGRTPRLVKANVGTRLQRGEVTLGEAVRTHSWSELGKTRLAEIEKARTPEEIDAITKRMEKEPALKKNGDEMTLLSESAKARRLQLGNAAAKAEMDAQRAAQQASDAATSKIEQPIMTALRTNQKLTEEQVKYIQSNPERWKNRIAKHNERFPDSQLDATGRPVKPESTTPPAPAPEKVGPTTEANPGENLESGFLNNVPGKKTPPAKVEPKTPKSPTESSIPAEPVSKKTVRPEVEATGPEAPPPKKFDPAKFTISGADIQLPPSTERGESFVKKLIQSRYDSYQLHPDSLLHNPMSSTGLGDALFNTIIGDIRNSTHLSVAEKQDALAALYKQVENGSIPITNADGGITNWRVSGAGFDNDKKRQIAKAIKRLNAEKKPVEVKSENGTTNTNTAANLENELTNKIVQDGEVVNRASEAVPPKSTAQPESIPDVPAEPQYVIRPEDWPSRFERMLSEIDKDEAQARSFLASDPDRFNLARHYGHENFWDNITMLNRGRGRGEITQKQYDAWRKELETRRNESRKRLDAEVEANAEKELKELMGDAQETSGQKQTSKPKTYTAVEDALGRTWVNSQEAADAGIRGYSTLKTLTDKIRFGMRDAAQGTKLRMQALWEKVLSSVPDKAKDLGKKILPASPKQTAEDIIDFISTPRMPLGKGRILTPELRKKMRNVFSENVKKLEEAALQTKKEKIDLAAQSKSAFDDLLKAERERNSALQQFNEDPKTKEYNTLEDILTEAKRIFDVENNKPITPETGGNESLVQATKNLDDAKSAVNKFLMDNPGFAAKKRVVDNTRNLFETAKQKYKDTTGESYTDKLSSNNIEDVITNGFNVNTRSQRPITLDSTGNMHIPISTEFGKGLDSGRYYGIGSGYTFNKGFLGGKPEIIVPKGKEITLKDVMNPSNQHTFKPDDVPMPDIVASKAKGGSRAGENAGPSKLKTFFGWKNVDDLAGGYGLVPWSHSPSPWGLAARGANMVANPFLMYYGIPALPNVPGALQEEYKEHYGTERGPVSWGDWALQMVPNGIYNASDMSRLREPAIKVIRNTDGSIAWTDPNGNYRTQDENGDIQIDAKGNVTETPFNTSDTDSSTMDAVPSKPTTAATAPSSAGAPMSKKDTSSVAVVPEPKTSKEKIESLREHAVENARKQGITVKDPKHESASDESSFNLGKWNEQYVPAKFNNLGYGHSLFGALAGGALGAGIGGLNYILTDENELSEEEKKKRSLARAMLSSAGIGAGIGGLVGGASDYTRA